MSSTARSLAGERAKTIQALRRQLVSSQQTQSSQKYIPTGLKSLDQLLPGGGLPTASVIEWISDEAGQAAASIALRALFPLLTLPGCLAVIDERHDFQSSAACVQGIPLSRILLVRPPRTMSSESPGIARTRFVRRVSACRADSLWALEQTAHCPGVRAIVSWLDSCSAAVMRRLQLAVERSGVTMMLIRPASALLHASFADLRLYVRPTSPSHMAEKSDSPDCSESLPMRSFAVQLLRSRHGLQHEGIAGLHQKPGDERIQDNPLQSPAEQATDRTRA